MGACMSNQSKTRNRSISVDKSFARMDIEVINLMNKEAVSQLKKTNLQSFEEVFGETATSFGDIRKVYKFETEKIGRGHFGTVKKAYLATYPGKIFAIKEILKEKLKTETHLLKRELDILRSLDHPNIIKFFEVYQDNKSFHLVMEYCSGGEVVKKIYLDKYLEENEAKKIMKQIFSAVIHLHDKGIAHRDLKPDNFLYVNKERTEIKMIDFGLSKRFDPATKLCSILGTPYYVAPEVLSGSYDEKCDIWSCGVIMYLMLSGDWPFNDPSRNEKIIFRKILKGKFTFAGPIWKRVGKPAKHLIQKLLVLDPSKRISARIALQHPWFTELNSIDRGIHKQAITPKILNRLKNFQIKNINRLQKEIIILIVHMINENELVKFKEAFYYMDQDFSGYLTAEDISVVLKEFGYNESPQEVNDIISSLSRLNSGYISYTEFIAATLDRKFYTNEERLWSAFKYFDNDDNGVITFANIKECFMRFGRRAKDSDIEIMLAEIKKTKNEVIKWEEFKHLLQIQKLEKKSEKFPDQNK